MRPNQQMLTAVYDCAQRSFRDQADRDYVSARALHRLGFDTQFFWSASQAIEKYLKAILLFNVESAKGLGHSLRMALQRVKSIEHLEISLSEGSLAFINYLDEEGQNRYFEFPSDLHSDALLRLDRCVWEVRRYCQPFSAAPPGWSGSETEWKKRCTDARNDARHYRCKHKFRISGGLLEDILRKPSQARDILIWKNFSFGRRRKAKIRYSARSASSNPTHFMHEEWYRHLEPLVDFSRPVRGYFQQRQLSI